jgi:hypothetical protein
VNLNECRLRAGVGSGWKSVSGAYRVLVGRSEGNKLLGRPRCRWEDNIEMDVQEMGWGMEWFDLA